MRRMRKVREGVNADRIDHVLKLQVEEFCCAE
jgi:hypothetical protein